MKIRILNSYYFKLVVLTSIAIIFDFILIKNKGPNIQWDQGYHLSNTFKMYNIYSFYYDDFKNLWNNLLAVTDSYRGPLTYFLSSIFLKIFGKSYENAYLSNHIFNIISIFSIYELGRIIHNKSVGFWASIIFTFSPLIINHRTDYLIDLSLTSFCLLTFLCLTKWFLSKTNLSLFSMISGILLGLVFLIKPTGILLLIFPIIIILSRRIYKFSNKSLIIIELFLCLISFLIIIYPWFSKNWLTIISSIINAWQWGVKYQDGFELNEFRSWFFYIFNIPNIVGKTTFWTFILLLIYRIFNFKSESIFYNKHFKLINILYFSYFFNVYILTALMSTKEIRFFLPMLPIICIYLSIILSLKNKLKEQKFKKIILTSLIISILLYPFNIYKNVITIQHSNKKNSVYSIRKDIIDSITENNEHLISTLAVLPDTKEINTFNLEAEATKQGENIAVRQIISNKETFEYDLENFDWFLIKSGTQGIMKNDAKELLEERLNDEINFMTFKSWELPDKSNLKLIKRNISSVNVKDSICNNSKPNIEIVKIKNGIKLMINGKGDILKSSKLLLDIQINKDILYENISVANGLFHPRFNENNCYFIEQNIPIRLNEDKDNPLIIDYILVDDLDNKISSERIKLSNFSLREGSLLMTNKIKKVEELGINLKLGQFDKLFTLVSLLNQSDPKQLYLKDSEKIYKIRYNKDKKEKDLYSILISQILQRKVKDAKDTAETIINISPNQNIYIAKAVINIYLLNIREARLSIEKARLLNEKTNNYELINTIESILNILEFKLI